MIRRLRRLLRWVLVGVGFVLMAVGLVGAFLPTHLLGFMLVAGLILVLRNSIRMRRRFILVQRRYPRYGWPLRRLLRGEVWPVIWHELLRSERFFIPRRLHRLRRLRFAIKNRLKR